MTSPTGLRLDIYDLLGGSVLLRWPEFLSPPSYAFYVYQALVTVVPAFTPPGNSVFAPPIGIAGYTFSPWQKVATVYGQGSPNYGLVELESSDGVIQLEAASGSGFFELEGISPGNGYQFIVTGLQVASYNLATGITPSLTYAFYVTAIPSLGGNELAGSNQQVVTPMPASDMLTTPMRRLWPFPNTGLD